MFRAKGQARAAVVADQTPLTGMPPGTYHTLGNDVVLEPNGRLHSPSKGCLVGSSSTMLECMNHLASLGFLTAEELRAVGLDNPLRLLGMTQTAVDSRSKLMYDPNRAIFEIDHSCSDESS